jgi:hypothetical protein
MWVIDALKEALASAGRIIESGAKVQGQARRELKDDMQQICSKCDAAYSTVIARLVPVKNSYVDAARLAIELRALAADQQTRMAFTPQHLCGEVDALLMKLQNNLDALKYAIDVRRIGVLRLVLQSMGHFDDAISDSYDGFMRQLDDIATELQASPAPAGRVEYVREVIADFEATLLDAIKQVRQTKATLLASL